MPDQYDRCRTSILTGPMKDTIGTTVKLNKYRKTSYLKGFMKALWILVLKTLADVQVNNLIIR
jgi:hypothetical protein